MYICLHRPLNSESWNITHVMAEDYGQATKCIAKDKRIPAHSRIVLIELDKLGRILEAIYKDDLCMWMFWLLICFGAGLCLGLA